MRVRVAPITPAPDGLLPGKDYEVIGIEADSYRIIDEAREPLLFEPTNFIITETTQPPFWRCSAGPDGERYCYPESWDRVGFFEDYFDGVATVRQQFWQEYATLYARAR